jgi:hypothetical protein
VIVFGLTELISLTKETDMLHWLRRNYDNYSTTEQSAQAFEFRTRQQSPDLIRGYIVFHAAAVFNTVGTGFWHYFENSSC